MQIDYDADQLAGLSDATTMTAPPQTTTPEQAAGVPRWVWWGVGIGAALIILRPRRAAGRRWARRYA